MKNEKKPNPMLDSVNFDTDELCENKKALGAFLTQFRIRKGYLKVSKFLEEIKLPFSDNYYRDIESGRKYLSVDSAVELHNHLKLDESSKISFDFFWHYFKDLLPREIHESLFGKGVESKDISSVLELREHDSKVLRRALSLNRYEREFIADEKIVNSFRDNFDLMPLMSYLYMVDQASVPEIRLVCQQLGLKFDQRVIDFLKLISKDRKSLDAPFVRQAPILRMPRNKEALRIKNKFLSHEVGISLEKEEKSEYFDVNGTFKYSAILTLKESELNEVQDRLVDLLSVLELQNKSGNQLEDVDTHPYFYGLVISGRPEYDGREARKKN
uniref:Uncharacterized protein n=1 Tax=Marinomonas sp. (strain MWYL1) TaxID=400668 RepID=A6VRK8_MARMS